MHICPICKTEFWFRGTSKNTLCKKCKNEKYKNKRCIICGAIDKNHCKQPEICKHRSSFPRLIKYLGYNSNMLGSEKAYNEYANEIMKSETIDKKERLLKSERKESIKNEDIIINNNEENKRKDSEIIELQQLINNVEIPEDLKENIQKKNFFNFEDSIFDSFQDNDNIMTNLEHNENLINIIKDENNE